MAEMINVHFYTFHILMCGNFELVHCSSGITRATIRSLCVLLPVMGLGWVFGIFSVNEDLVAFQYIFAVFNALQGFFIFLFHCVFNRKLKDAFKQRRARKKRLYSVEDSNKKQSSSVTTPTTYCSNDGSEKTKTETVSNPLLEADRQMQELDKKNKRGSENQFCKAEPNNKVQHYEDKPNVDVALEDVKISNILRESEVKGEAADSRPFSTHRRAGADIGHSRTEEIVKENELKNIPKIIPSHLSSKIPVFNNSDSN